MENKVRYKGGGRIYDLGRTRNKFCIKQWKEFDRVDEHSCIKSNEKNVALFFSLGLLDYLENRKLYITSRIVMNISEWLEEKDEFFQNKDISLEKVRKDVETTSLAYPDRIKTIKVEDVNGKWLAYYLPEENVLYATDMVHCPHYVTALEKVLNEIEKVVKIKRVKSPRGKKLGKITLGCDPEFEVIREGREIVNAGEIILQRGSKIGRDDAGSQVELRPDPATSASELTRNVKQLVMDFAKKYKNYGLGVEGDNYPLGGHIHFGVKEGKLPWTKDFALVLDNWVGKKLINLSGDARGSYKTLAIDSNNGEVTRALNPEEPWGFEYRVLPSAVFHNPKVLRAVLRIVKRLAEKYYNGWGVPLAPTDDESYTKLGIGSSWKIIKKFIQDYPHKDKMIFQFWGVKKSEKEINIWFKDEWTEEVKSVVRTFILNDKDIKKKIKKISGEVRLLICGLHEDRGKVTTGFSAEGYKRIDLFEDIYREEDFIQLRYGIPKERRMEYGEQEFWNALKDQINRDIETLIVRR